MQNYVVTAFGSPLASLELPDPQPVGKEVVVEVTHCGVCHTDLHLQDGFYSVGGGKRLNLVDRGISPPLTLGHEVLGRLVAAGPDADISPDSLGRTFLVYPWIGCGTCVECERGEEPLCATPAALGVARPGGYGEKCLVPDARYLVDVDGLDPAVAATYACSGLTAYSALRKLDVDRENGALLIVGLGGVGLSGLYLARAMGFHRVIVAEIDAAKREVAQGIDGVEVIDPTQEDALESADLVGKVAAAVDFVGTGETAQFAVNSLRKGGSCVIVGLFGGELSLPLPPLVQRSLTVRGSFVGSLDELRQLVQLALAGGLQELPVTAVPFADADAALNRLRQGAVAGRQILTREE